MPAKLHTQKVWILVKAYPQPSTKYEETVCCAAISEEGQLLRLYPIRYRKLKPSQQFGRFDLVEIQMEKSSTDMRPESYRVSEDSIRIIQSAKKSSSHSKASLWKPLICRSLANLKEAQQQAQKSLGIIRPDRDTLKFSYSSLDEQTAEDAESQQNLYQQACLFEKSLNPLEPPEFAFYYSFKSDGKPHKMQLHDWEVQETYRQYKLQYGSKENALKMMKQFYGQDILTLDPHFIMGNMMRSPKQFMIIGILRSSQQQASQMSLF
jgi:hypothetical protein